MLAFNMETRRINDLINEGAAAKISDKRFLEKELKKFIGSEKRREMISGDLYYDYEQAINGKRRLVISDGGELKEDPNLPNNKYLDNQYQKMVDQKVNYMLSKGITFNTDNDEYADALKQIFNRKFHRMFKNLGKDAYNGGIGWLYPYYDENGEFKIRRFHPWEILPFWKDSDHEELDFAVRIYEVQGYEGENEKVFTYVEVYDTQGIHKFEYKNGALVPDYQTYYFDMPNLDGELVPYNWDRVPLIAFKSNSTETPLIKKCRSLQDGINQIMSDFGDGMQENLSGNTVLIIKNYDGQDLGEFRRNLATYKAVKVSSINGAEGGLDALSIEVNSANYQTILGELKKALIQNCKGYDIAELKASGSPNEMTIKAVYSDIDLDANELETEFQASFEDLLYFINVHLMNAGMGDFNAENVDVIFNRDMMVNESQIIADINASSAILSKRTLIAQHPYITDVEDELERLDEEAQESLDVYGAAFDNTPDNVDGDNVNEEE